MKHLIRILLILYILPSCTTPLAAQDNYRRRVESVGNSELVKNIFEYYKSQRAELIQTWKEIARIYAPSGNEVLRAKYILDKFRDYGIENAHMDAHGNAVAVIKGNSEGPSIAILGTMDDLATVADLVKTWNKPILERDGKLFGPGTNIGATCINILGTAKLLTQPGVKFAGTVYLAGVVQEETGMKGIKGLLEDHPDDIDYLVDIMSGVGSVTYGAIGIHWFKMHFKGERGHTLSGGLPNVTRGVAKAIDQVYSIPIPTDPPEKKTRLNIAMLGGGRVFNHKSEDAWFSVDLRSMDNNILISVKDKILKICEKVAKEEGLETWVEPYSVIPAGQIPGARKSDLVRVAEEATRFLGVKPRLNNSGSSNMNIAISKGILSISTSGNRGGGRDTPDEYANIEPNLNGAKLSFLIVYSLLNGMLH